MVTRALNHIFAIGGSEAMRIDSSGRLLVGTSTSRAVGSVIERAIQVEGTNYADSSISITCNSASASPTLSFGRSRGTLGGSTIVNDGDDLGYILFSGADGSDIGSYGAWISCQVDGTPGANDMPGRLMFSTTADGASTPTERMRIDSSGNLLVGKTSGNTIGTAGIEIDGNNNRIMATRDGNEPLLINRLTSDGTLVDLKKDGTTVGRIGSYSGTDTFITGGSGNSTGLVITSTAIVPSGAAGATNSNVNLGLSAVGRRFNNLWLDGGVYLGGTGAANLLDDYEEGTWTPVLTGATSGTYTFAGTNTYTKVGNQVTVWGEAVANNGTAAFGTLSGTASITGLPFTPANDSTATMYYFNYSGTGTPYCLIVNGSTSINIRKFEATTANNAVDAGDIDGTNNIRFCITYQV
jgi:hypothetical protein